MYRLLLVIWLLLAGLLSLGARAQCAPSPPPAGCANAFDAYDVATGQLVTTLCAGRPVEFRPCRPPTSLVAYFVVTPTTGTTLTPPPGCSFNPSLPGSTYTPTAATDAVVTVAELEGQPGGGGGGTGTLYLRNYPVRAFPQPRATLLACAGGTARLTVDTGYDQYQVLIGSATTGPVLAPGASLTIAASAGTPITVVGSYTGNTLCSNSLTQPTPALAAPGTLALSQLRSLGPLPGQLNVVLDGLVAGYTYEVQQATGSSFVTVGTTQPSGGGSQVVLTLNAPGPGQYRLRQLDACQNVLATTPAAPTVELSGTSLNNVNALSWRAGGPVSGYTLLRDGAVLATLPPAATTYDDRAVTCGTRYTYELQSRNAGTLSTAGPVSLLTTSTLAPPTPLLNASFDLASRLTLTATLPGGAALPAGSTLTYSRQGGPGAITFAAVPAATDTLRDPAPLAELLAAPPCYTALLQDVCGNRSAPGSPVCPVLLTAEPADPDGRTARLNWTAFQGPGGPGAPVSYRVLTVAADGTVLAASAATAARTYLDGSPPADRQVLRYRIEASGGGLPAGQLSYSNLAAVTRRPLLAIPNAFTPNGDGLNDVLEVKGRYLAAFTFVVVDRNGQEVFRATDRSQTWDGTIQGRPPVNAPYVWRFTMTDETGQAFSQTGTVSVLK